MAPPRPSAWRPKAGISTLEALVAVSIISATALTAAQSIGFGAQVWRRETASHELNQDFAIAATLLRRIPADLELFIYDASARGQNIEVRLLGTPVTMTLFVKGPSQQELARVQLNLSSDQQGAFDKLFVELSDWPPDQEDRLHAVSRTTVSLSPRNTWRFSYFGGLAPNDPPIWRPTWSDSMQAPLAIALHPHQLDSRAIVVALNIAAPCDPLLSNTPC